MEIFEKIQEIPRNTKLFSTAMVYKCSSQKVNEFYQLHQEKTHKQSYHFSNHKIVEKTVNSSELYDIGFDITNSHRLTISLS